MKKKDIKFANYLNFVTDQEAIDTFDAIDQAMPGFLALPLSMWKSLKVLHDEPEVWRLWIETKGVRINLHLIAPASDPFFHFHPSPSVVKCVGGGYWHRTGAYTGSVEEFMAAIQHTPIEEMTVGITATQTLIVPGSVYVMTDPRQCHQVLVQKGSGWNSSLMITGKPYFPGASKLLSRKPPVANPPLTDEEKLKVLNPVRKFYGLVEW